jgi:NAD(P)-dependent dehydrogenase (short-subunit alcohol dehydrogenase family)
MRFHGKSVVIYGANSPIGGTVARAFAAEGATVYLAGRTTSRLRVVANEIMNAGGAAEVAQVDPLDPSSVSEHLHQVVVDHGAVDVSVNLAFLGIEAPTRLCNLTDEQFAAAAFVRARSNFVTMAAASSRMALQGQGIIVATAAPQGAVPEGKQAGRAIGSAAIEELCGQLSRDVGSFGVRVAYLADVPTSENELIPELFRVLATSRVVPPSPGEIGRGAAISSSSLRVEAAASAATS